MREWQHRNGLSGVGPEKDTLKTRSSYSNRFGFELFVLDM